jgi:hypothetical protein
MPISGLHPIENTTEVVKNRKGEKATQPRSSAQVANGYEFGKKDILPHPG